MTQETPTPSTTATEELHGCAPPLGCILLIGVVVVGLSIFSIPIFNALYGIIFPPTPPLPTDAIEIQKTVIEHGVEETRYTISSNICQTIQFFIDAGGECDIFWDFCTGETFTSMSRGFMPYAECRGTTSVGIYGIRWKAVLDVLYPPEQTAFTLSHEVLWGGMPRPTPIPD